MFIKNLIIIKNKIIIPPKSKYVCFANVNQNPHGRANSKDPWSQTCCKICTRDKNIKKNILGRSLV